MYRTALHRKININVCAMCILLYNCIIIIYIYRLTLYRPNTIIYADGNKHFDRYVTSITASLDESARKKRRDGSTRGRNFNNYYNMYTAQEYEMYTGYMLISIEYVPLSNQHLYKYITLTSGSANIFYQLRVFL